MDLKESLIYIILNEENDIKINTIKKVHKKYFLIKKIISSINGCFYLSKEFDTILTHGSDGYLKVINL